MSHARPGLALLKAGQYDDVEAIAMSRQGANLARAVGWALYNTHRYTALGIQFITKEGQNYLLRGWATLGWQTYRQDAAPVFPLENSTDF